ncbi:MAG: ribonuclease Z [Verrucomicrobiae bacterium]|nr:ribonuclease Z [Verrucomicrobiae bacterium]
MSSSSATAGVRRSVTCFGVGEGWPSGDRRHASFLYRCGNTTILVDCGDGMSTAFKAAGIAYEAVDAVFLSHMHSDHVGGFSMFVQSLWLQQRRRPLPVYAAPRALAALAAWLEAVVLPPELIGFVIEWRPLTGGQAVPIGEVTVTAHPTSHLESLRRSLEGRHPATAFEAFSFVLSGPGFRVSHTADIGDVADLQPLLVARPELLICELSHVELEPLCAALRAAPPGRVVFVHVARDHLEAPGVTERRLQELLNPVPFSLGRDGEVVHF